ncbi:MAG TPA: hypothetical protein VMW10_01420, partial [Alphaproteobacteria bacterium]|nr:hypothetical protein [Alphaproteobacteria bacterium]
MNHQQSLTSIISVTSLAIFLAWPLSSVAMEKEHDDENPKKTPIVKEASNPQSKKRQKRGIL